MTFLSAALKAIPAAATSPLALAAYVMALAAWTLIAYRVNRSKVLLEHITALPERDRLAALQTEIGYVKLRRGLSPTQWLAAQRQKYFFAGFLAVCGVLIIVFAIAVSLAA